MNLNDLIKDEIDFCKSIDAEMNEKHQYIYESKNMKSVVNLPFILKEYREWLIDNNKIKIE